MLYSACDLVEQHRCQVGDRALVGEGEEGKEEAMGFLFYCAEGGDARKIKLNKYKVAICA